VAVGRAAPIACVFSQNNSPWPLGRPITDLTAAGLSTLPPGRFNLFTLDHRLVLDELGSMASRNAENMCVDQKKLDAKI
jgi:hypothetical protein